MKTYSVHNQEGRILRLIESTSEDIALLNVVDGEDLIEGAYPADAFYVRDGVALPYPTKPGPWSVFDHAAEEWADPRTPDDLAAELQEARRAGIGCVNSAADAVRRRYVTMIAGQDMLYLRKEAEARAYLADPDPDPADYPLIMAEVGITAPEAWHVAQVYLGLSAVWISLAAPLETARLGAIAQIEVAEDAETIRAIVAAACAQIAAISNPTPEQPA
ncbi:hypothetical protein [Cereibacter sediminicola]|uniref:hypothetical protein n=1 Tax=Cereibacter sediminicola TaxID=2584941 RepID=UPI0011A53D62|nr:hypothetical protein [Cereibacter sediminicola]